MRIKRLRCFAVTLPLTAGKYEMSHGRVLDKIDSTVLELTASDGTTGYGETSTLGSNYIDGFAGSLRAAVKELASVIFESDVMQPKVLNFAMDEALLGHRPAKALIDSAFWDVRGKRLDQPVYNLLGGELQSSYPVFYVVSLADPSVMAAEAADRANEGFKAWQLKLGSDPLTDAVRVSGVCEAIGESGDFVTCDGNRGWTMADAIRFIHSPRDRRRLRGAAGRVPPRDGSVARRVLTVRSSPMSPYAPHPTSPTPSLSVHVTP